jgi:hypothetical protein
MERLAEGRIVARYALTLKEGGTPNFIIRYLSPRIFAIMPSIRHFGYKKRHLSGLNSVKKTHKPIFGHG